MNPPRQMNQAGEVALAKIESHEEACVERMDTIKGWVVDIKATLKDHDRRFDQINLAAWSVAAALATMTIAFVSWLWVQVYPVHGTPAAAPAPAMARP